MSYLVRTAMRIKPINRLILKLFEDMGIIYTCSQKKVTYMAFPYVLKRNWEEDEYEVCSLEDLPDGEDEKDLKCAISRETYPSQKESQ